jgi:hypothetical protein
VESRHAVNVNTCFGGLLFQCSGPIGGWKFSRTIDGVRADYARAHNAQANVISDKIIQFECNTCSKRLSAVFFVAGFARNGLPS